MIEPPNGTVLRLLVGGVATVWLVERDDESAMGSPHRWFLPNGDPETWSEIETRLRRAAEWRVVTAPLSVLDALTTLRGQFDQALATADAGPPGAARASAVQAALFNERAAQALAAAAGMPPIDWSRGSQPEPAVAVEQTSVMPVVEPDAAEPPAGRLRDVLTAANELLPTVSSSPSPERRPTNQRFLPGRAGVGVNQAGESRWRGTHRQPRRNEGQR